MRVYTGKCILLEFILVADVALVDLFRMFMMCYYADCMLSIDIVLHAYAVLGLAYVIYIYIYIYIYT